MKSLKARTSPSPEEIYLCFMLFTLPLVMHRGYFDITETKALWFTVWTAALLIFLGLRALLKKAQDFRPEKTDSWMLAFAGLYILACLLSGQFAGALLADDNRYQGVLTMLLYAGIFMVIAHGRVRPSVALGWLTAGACIVTLLGILNHLSVDPLGTVRPLRPFDRGRYISTIGNINFYGAYFCLLLPVLWVKLCTAEARRGRVLWGGLSVPATWGVMCSKGEGPLLGLTAALLLLPLLCRKEKAMRRMPLLLPLTALSMGAFGLLARLAGGDGFSVLTKLLLRPGAVIILSLAGLGGWLILRRLSVPAGKKLYRLYTLLLLLGLAVLVLLLILFNTGLLGGGDDFLSRYLIIDDDWGTDRGKVWRSCWEGWLELPLWQKLLGGGSGMVLRIDLKNRVFTDALLDSAHSEWLHYLITNGILGLVAYAGLLCCCFRRALKSREPVMLALSAGAAGYLVQSSVNIAQPFTTPIFILILAVMAGAGQNHKEKRPKRA